MSRDLEIRSRRLAIGGSLLIPTVVFSCVLYWSLFLYQPVTRATEIASSMVQFQIVQSVTEPEPVEIEQEVEEVQEVQEEIPERVQETVQEPVVETQDPDLPQIVEEKEIVEPEPEPEIVEKVEPPEEIVPEKPPEEVVEVEEEISEVENEFSSEAREEALEAEGETVDELADESIATAISQLVAAIEKKKRYPRAAQRAGYGGLVNVRVVLSQQGHVIEASLDKTSGRATLDRAALKAATSLVGDKVVHVELSGDLVVTVPIRFSLN